MENTITKYEGFKFFKKKFGAITNLDFFNIPECNHLPKQLLALTFISYWHFFHGMMLSLSKSSPLVYDKSLSWYVIILLDFSIFIRCLSISPRFQLYTL